MKKTREVFWTEKKWRKIFSVFVSVLLWGILAVSIIIEGFEWPSHAISIFLMALIMAGLALGFKMNKPVSIIFTLLIPAASFYAVEGYSHLALTDISGGIQFLNLLVFYLLFAILWSVFGKSSVASAALSLIVMIIGLINYYVVAFRGTPVVPWDLLSVSTALSVTKNYVFSLDGRVVMISMIFILMAVLGSRIDLHFRWSIKREIFLAASVVISTVYVFFLQTPFAAEKFNLDDILFTPNVMYRNNGFTVSFLTNLQYLRFEKPDGYSEEAVKEIIQKTYEAAGEASGSKEIKAGPEQYPNIVVVMNESFSDMGEIALFSTNKDYMPFIHSMQKGEVDNCVTGKLLTSVLGGNTANSEFEFLTGDTMAFLPPGSIAYQQYIKSRTPNFAMALNENEGYDTTAIHPYYASGWEREIVYPYFGFGSDYFLEDMQEDGALKKNAEYLRKYISDKSLVNMLTDMYENKAGDRPLFTFAVTMQNHGGYFDAYDNFKQQIELLNVEDDYNKSYMDMYLSLIKESDEAFENLINYFKDYEEPTIVLMFGDHQPGDYVINSIYDTEKKRSLEESQNRYTVPFVMWANFDIEDEQIDKISVNYLSVLLSEKAGIPMTGYQTYLSQLRETLPVITANVIIDKDGNYYANNRTKDCPYEDILNEYSILQYNHLFDKEHRQNEFFGDTSGD